MRGRCETREQRPVSKLLRVCVTDRAPGVSSSRERTYGSDKGYPSSCGIDVVRRLAMRPILMINPRSDVEFSGLAEQLVRDGVSRPEELEARLRERYPRAVVRERIISDEHVMTWYVYREGRWTKTLTP
jgi:hypothetical protein